jgi:hypothetical protein
MDPCPPQKNLFKFGQVTIINQSIKSAPLGQPALRRKSNQDLPSPSIRYDTIQIPPSLRSCAGCSFHANRGGVKLKKEKEGPKEEEEKRKNKINRLIVLGARANGDEATAAASSRREAAASKGRPKTVGRLGFDGPFFFFLLLARVVTVPLLSCFIGRRFTLDHTGLQGQGPGPARRWSVLLGPF